MPRSQQLDPGGRKPARAAWTGRWRCREMFADRQCGRLATHIAGVDGLGYYPICERCVRFWAPECVRPLNESEAA